MPVPLVPVKALAEAKGRLAPQVGPLQRRLLAIAMFEDVVAALEALVTAIQRQTASDATQPIARVVADLAARFGAAPSYLRQVR